MENACTQLRTRKQKRIFPPEVADQAVSVKPVQNQEIRSVPAPTAVFYKVELVVPHGKYRSCGNLLKFQDNYSGLGFIGCHYILAIIIFLHNFSPPRNYDLTRYSMVLLARDVPAKKLRGCLPRPRNLFVTSPKKWNEGFLK